MSSADLFSSKLTFYKISFSFNQFGSRSFIGPNLGQNYLNGYQQLDDTHGQSLVYSLLINVIINIIVVFQADQF